MLAVIETGGKQYLISPSQTLKIEKLKTPKRARILLLIKCYY